MRLGFRVLLRCVGEAVVAHGFRGLIGLAPFGDHLFDIAAFAWDRYRVHCREGEMQSEVQAALQASLGDIKAEVNEVVEEMRSTADPATQTQLAKPEVLEALKSYLTQIPGTIRQSMRRPSEPSGSTTPRGFSVQGPTDLLKLLPVRPSRFRPGDQPVGNWVLTELLGIGGFGEVWKAEHPTLKGIPPVALKFCLDTEAASSLRHEAALLNRVMSQSSQPGIVTLRNAWLDSEPICLEYDYINGGDLCGLLGEWEQMLPERRISQAAQVIRRLAMTVGYFHKLTPSIVHRDLKPSNILVQRKGNKVELKIADFGIGGLSAKRDLARSQGGISRGDLLSFSMRGSHTPLYASPQQVRGESADPRDDVHALGVIWYQSLTGSLQAGPGPDYEKDLQERNVPAETIKLLGQCVSAKAERRLANGEELAQRLRSLFETSDELAPQTQGSSEKLPEVVSAPAPSTSQPQRSVPAFPPPGTNRQRPFHVPSTNVSPKLSCPSCGKSVAFPESHRGQKVRCPLCQHVFTANPPEEIIQAAEVVEAVQVRPTRPRAPEPEEKLDRPRRRRVADEEDEVHGRRVKRPHRGGLMLTLGILTAVMGLCCPLICWILGAVTLIMASGDLKAMARREMNRSGRGMTNTGKILAIVGLVVSIPNAILGFVLTFVKH